jgi:hypothetical protein
VERIPPGERPRLAVEVAASHERHASCQRIRPDIARHDGEGRLTAIRAGGGRPVRAPGNARSESEAL